MSKASIETDMRDYGLSREQDAKLYTKREIEELKRVAVEDFAMEVLAEVQLCAKEDSPLYEGDKEVDCFVRMSDVNEAINKHLN